MDMRELSASDIGKRITISYPESDTNDQITGTLTSVAHGTRGDQLRSEITVKVAEESYSFHNQRGGRWLQKLKL